MKLVETSLTIESEGVRVARPELLMCTLQRAADHEGGETS
jgi:hypothetical protein